MKFTAPPENRDFVFIAIASFCLFLLAIFSSCTPEPYTIANTHLLIVDPATPDIYFYADLSNPHVSWVEKDNGDMYRISYSGNSAIIYSDEQMKEAYYYVTALDRSPEGLKISQANSISKEALDIYGSFKIVY